MTTITYTKFTLEIDGRTIHYGGPLAVGSVETSGPKPEPMWSGTLKAECDIETTEADRRVFWRAIDEIFRRQRMVIPARWVSFLAVDLERVRT